MNWLYVIVPIIILVLVAVLIYNPKKQCHRQKELRKIAVKVSDGLNKHNVNYWVDYGTLLGIVREQDIILHDNDVDFCLMPEPDLANKLIDIVNEMGREYKLEYHPWGAFRVVLDKYSYFADLYLIEEKDGLYVDPTGKIPFDLVGNKSTIQWMGVDVSVPEKVHETLVWRYGESYMTPDPNKDAEN